MSVHLTLKSLNFSLINNPPPEKFMELLLGLFALVIFNWSPTLKSLNLPLASKSQSSVTIVMSANSVVSATLQLNHV